MVGILNQYYSCFTRFKMSLEFGFLSYMFGGSDSHSIRSEFPVVSVSKKLYAHCSHQGPYGRLTFTSNNSLNKVKKYKKRNAPSVTFVVQERSMADTCSCTHTYEYAIHVMLVL